MKFSLLSSASCSLRWLGPFAKLKPSEREGPGDFAAPTDLELKKFVNTQCQLKLIE